MEDEEVKEVESDTTCEQSDGCENKKSKRVWEIDALRGFAILWMICSHILFNLGYAFSYYFRGTFLESISNMALNIYMSNISETLTYIFCAGVFLLCAGICCTFSRSSLRRGIITSIVAIGITLVSAIATVVLGFFMTIWFGILHCFAVCLLLSPLLKKIKTIYLLPLGLVIIVLGEIFSTITVGNNFWVIFNFYSATFSSADYYPLFPFLGIFVFGIYLGKTIYKEKKSLFSRPMPALVRPFAKIGKYPLIIYLGHQVVLYLLFFILIMVI